MSAARKLTPVQQAYERCKPGRAALLEVAQCMECTEDKCGIVWERFVFRAGESVILFATPHWWDVFVPLCSDGRITAVVDAIKQRAVKVPT